MVITVNTRIISGNTALSRIIVDSLRMIAAVNPQHEFVFIAEKEFANENNDSHNVRHVILKQNPGNPYWWKYWYDYRLTAALKKYNAGVVIHAGSICSLRTKVPQYMIADDFLFQGNGEWYPKNYSGFMQKNMTRFLQTADRVFSFSETLNDTITKKYLIEENKIIAIPLCMDIGYEPCNVTAAESIKEKYSDGKEYFLFRGAVHRRNDLTTLLKAFSLFKKRQKSNMQLLIVPDSAVEDIQFIKSLQSYKYRNDVKLIENADSGSIRLITASAYASIGLGPMYTDLITLLNAMQCGVPVISGNKNHSTELLKEAALYANQLQPEDIAEKMMLLYKDENKRDELIRKGIQHAAGLSLEKTAAQLWQNIPAVVQPA